jgi:hypothetical protein
MARILTNGFTQLKSVQILVIREQKPHAASRIRLIRVIRGQKPQTASRISHISAILV